MSYAFSGPRPLHKVDTGHAHVAGILLSDYTSLHNWQHNVSVSTKHGIWAEELLINAAGTHLVTDSQRQSSATNEMRGGCADAV